jgi:two-component system chemotaxis response regulator CheY
MGMNFEFFESARADLGLTILETGAIDLVIADINMPGMDGLAFLREVRASTNAGMRRVPVVLLTSDKSPETRARAISSGASGFVLKPVTSSNLRETVTSLLKANARLG